MIPRMTCFSQQLEQFDEVKARMLLDQFLQRFDDDQIPFWIWRIPGSTAADIQHPAGDTL